ncbi:MAG: SMR family transporter [Desulfovibrionaceae bacterium]|nr:SMR family transporter [Desulfovibrionaceae bacterium]
MSSPVRLHHWCALCVAILFEVSGTSLMKLSHGWSFAYAPQVGLLAMWLCIALSYYSLSLATLAMPVGVAFALWDGIGLVLITLCSVLFMGEIITLTKAAGLLCVLAGGLLVHHGTDTAEVSHA